MKKLLVLSIILSLAMSANATTYFVKRTGGSDGNTGVSWAAAWSSLNKVQATLVGGDTVVFGPGIYRGTKLSPPSGSSGDYTCYIDSGFYYATPTTYPTVRSAYIYGSDTIPAAGQVWTSAGTNLWTTPYTSSISVPALFKNDSCLMGVTSNPSSVLQYRYTGSAIVVFNVGTPTAHYEAAVRSCFQHGSFTSLIGLGIGYSYTRTIDENSSGSPHTNENIIHCKIFNNAGDAGSNAALIYTGAPQSSHARNMYHRIVACSLGGSWGISPTFPTTAEFRFAGEGVCWYSNWYSIVDSCILYGHMSSDGLHLKYNLTTFDGWPNNYKDTFALNYLYGDTAYNYFTNSVADQSRTQFGIRIHGDARSCAIYGNVIANYWNGILFHYGAQYYNGTHYWDTTGEGSVTTPQGGTFGSLGNHLIANNTIYNCAVSMRVANQDGLPTSIAPSGGSVPSEFSDLVFKWNIVYNTWAAAPWYSPYTFTPYTIERPKNALTIDSNLYYLTTGASFLLNGVSFSSWQTVSQSGAALRDVHNSSATTNPNFTNASALNFSRTSAPVEMNQTYPLGTFQKYGAVQNTAVVIPTGACCISNVCSITSQASCQLAGGTYYGDNTTCPQPTCVAVTPTGACCLPGSVCATGYTSTTCAAAGGVYQGDNSTTCSNCTPAVTPQTRKVSGSVIINGKVIFP